MKQVAVVELEPLGNWRSKRAWLAYSLDERTVFAPELIPLECPYPARVV